MTKLGLRVVVVGDDGGESNKAAKAGKRDEADEC